MALVWLALIATFFGDWLAMARQWWDISTYNHVLLIPLILGWLVAQRLPELLRLSPRPWWPGLILCAGALFVWLLGAFSGLNLARQLGAVLLLMAAVPTLLGPKVAVGVLFPLGYMLLMVPFGEEFVPDLQMVTAEITIALVRLSGIPAVIDGVFIDTPVGLFEVAEACSGVKFLIAMIAFGLLVANACFVGWTRRAVLMAACVVVPVLANGVRAWGTIYAAQFFGIEVAAGFDHIVYGWVFFAIVLALVIAGAWRFFDRAVDDPVIDAGRIERSPLMARVQGATVSGARPTLAVLGGIALLVICAQGWAYAAATMSARLPRQIFLPQVPGWHRVDYRPTVWWEPRAQGAGHRLLGRYANARGQQVDVFVAVYAEQGEGREAGGFGQGALMPASAWAWRSDGPVIGQGKSERLVANGHVDRLAVTWYRTGDLLTGSNARLKLAVMADRLLLRARPTTLLILSAEDRPGAPAEQAVVNFRKDAGPLDRWMDRLASVQ